MNSKFYFKKYKNAKRFYHQLSYQRLNSDILRAVKMFKEQLPKGTVTKKAIYTICNLTSNKFQTAIWRDLNGFSIPVKHHVPILNLKEELEIVQKIIEGEKKNSSLDSLQVLGMVGFFFIIFLFFFYLYL